MALRAFRSNPGLGGFGGESSDAAEAEQDCDAFAQILKELVDNAVDACSSTSNSEPNTDPKRVRVTIERFEEKEGDNDLLEVTVTDNGGGMENIEDCVEAFRTTKGRDEGRTAGRYGIGLTLCLLHAQRLVPNHYATITSATATQEHFTKASYVVDTERDKVKRVKRETFPKLSPEESGTAVKLLVPGGAMSEQAWPRLAEYFARFRLSLGLQCSLEVKAPTLATIPMFVLSKQERHAKWKASYEQPWNENMAGDDKSSDGELSSPKQCKKSKEYDETRREIQMAAATFLGKSIEYKNVAHSEEKIRHASATKGQYPVLEVDMVVFSPNDPNDDDDEGTESDEGTPSETRTATMTLIRMVNRIPLLDSAEAAACGLVQGVTSRSSTWNSFGLGVSRSNERAKKELGQRGRTFVPYFAVKDSDHVAPFFSQGTHARFDDDDDDEDCDNDGSDRDSRSSDGDTEQQKTTSRKRKQKKKQVILLPAHLRLGSILLMVQINADPKTLPLPTLSKGRLPLNDESIDKALESGIKACLRSLQKTNPTLLLTTQQLKTTVRDTRYIPSVAAALAGIACKSKNKKFQSILLEASTKWEEEGATAAGKGSQLALRVDSLGPALERRLRLICAKTDKCSKKRKVSASQKMTKSKVFSDKENDSDMESAFREESSQEPYQSSTGSSPRKAPAKKESKACRRLSLGSGGSIISAEEDCSVQETAPRFKIKEDDDYEYEDWL